jgi:O-antigen ligase
LLSKARHRVPVILLVLVFIVPIVGLLLFGVEDFYNILGQRIESAHEGLISRMPIVLAAVKMGASHPITGVGIGNFPVYWLNHAEILGDFMVEYWISYIERGEMPMTHNMFLSVWAEMGGFGLFALIWLLWRGWQNFHLFSLPSRMDDSLSHGISLMRIRDGLQAAYLAIIVSSFSVPIEHYLFLWFLLATSFMMKSYAVACKLTSPMPDSGFQSNPDTGGKHNIIVSITK